MRAVVSLGPLSPTSGRKHSQITGNKNPHEAGLKSESVYLLNGSVINANPPEAATNETGITTPVTVGVFLVDVGNFSTIIIPTNAST